MWLSIEWDELRLLSWEVQAANFLTGGNLFLIILNLLIAADLSFHPSSCPQSSLKRAECERESRRSGKTDDRKRRKWQSGWESDRSTPFTKVFHISLQCLLSTYLWNHVLTNLSSKLKSSKPDQRVSESASLCSCCPAEADLGSAAELRGVPTAWWSCGLPLHALLGSASVLLCVCVCAAAACFVFIWLSALCCLCSAVQWHGAEKPELWLQLIHVVTSASWFWPIETTGTEQVTRRCE